MTVDDFKCRMRGHLYNPESIAAIALRRKITEFEEILFNSLNFSFESHMLKAPNDQCVAVSEIGALDMNEAYRQWLHVLIS